MTIGDGIAFASFMALIGWYFWLVQRRSVLIREFDEKRRRDANG